MRQLTMTEDRAVEWWDVPEPTLDGPGEALVRPHDAARRRFAAFSAD